MEQRPLFQSAEPLPWILIPAYQPDVTLVELCQTLITMAGNPVLVVDDGSARRCAPIFETVRQMPRVTVLRHAANRGKGQALKTGINYFLLNASAHCAGVVTADADGQHLPRDIIKLAKAGQNTRECVLGVREFSASVPVKSRYGNKITRCIFRALVGRSVTDTQTGLRFLPRDLLAEVLCLPYDRYEYELATLVTLAKKGLPINEVPVETVYINGNRSSHFNPLLDSLAIYSVLLRFSGISVTTVFLDYLIFTLLFYLGSPLFWAFVSARIVAGTFNFVSAKKWVFTSDAPVKGQAFKFALLVFALMLVSWAATEAVFLITGGYVLAAKVLAEASLFFVSYCVQRHVIFKIGSKGQRLRPKLDNSPLRIPELRGTGTPG